MPSAPAAGVSASVAPAPSVLSMFSLYGFALQEPIYVLIASLSAAVAIGCLFWAVSAVSNEDRVSTITHRNYTFVTRYTRLPIELIFRIIQHSDRRTRVSWSEVCHFTRVEALKLLVDDVYQEILANRRILDYDTMSEASIADYRITTMDALTNLPYLVNSGKIRMAANVTISLHRTWYENLGDPTGLMSFVEKVATMGDAFRPNRHIAHTIRLDVPNGIDLQLARRFLEGWTMRLGMRLEIHTENPHRSTTQNDHFVQDIINASGDRTVFTSPVVFLNSPYPFAESMLRTTVAHLRSVQHLKLGNVMLSKAQMTAFLTLVDLPNILTIVITVRVPLDAVLAFIHHHHNLLESVKIEGTMDDGSRDGAEFDMTRLVILEAPYTMLRRLLPRIQSAPNLEVVVYQDSGDVNLSSLSMESDMRQLSRFASSLSFIRMFMSVRSEISRRYIKNAYRGERVEPAFHKLKEIQVFRCTNDDVFVPLWFTVRMQSWSKIFPLGTRVWAPDFGGYLHALY